MADSENKPGPRRRRQGPARTYGPPASRLQAERVRRGWTQADVGAFLARLVGRDKPYGGGYVHRLEIAHYPPTKPLLDALASLFGVSSATMQGWLGPATCGQVDDNAGSSSAQAAA